MGRVPPDWRWAAPAPDENDSASNSMRNARGMSLVYSHSRFVSILVTPSQRLIFIGTTRAMVGVSSSSFKKVFQLISLLLVPKLVGNGIVGGDCQTEIFSGGYSHNTI